MKLSLFLLPGLSTGFSPFAKINLRCLVSSSEALFSSNEPFDEKEYLPKVGCQFQLLIEPQSKKVLKQLMDFSGPYIHRISHSATRDFNLNETRIVVGLYENYIVGADINCYQYAIDEYRHGQMDKQYPGRSLPDLKSSRRADNCEALKHNIFDEFGTQIREVSAMNECHESEVAITSYVSQEPDEDGIHDFHFIRHSDGVSWHKPGQLPVESVDNKMGDMQRQSTIYIFTTDDADDALGFIEGVGWIKKFYVSSGTDYFQCHMFCLDTA